MRTKTDSKGWKNILSVIWADRKHFTRMLTDNQTRLRFQFAAVYIIFTVVSAVMTLVNVFSVWRALMWSTLIFSAVNLVNFGLCFIGPRAEKAAQVLFGAEAFCLFLFFLIVGEPEGFSAIWIVMLPACCMLLYELKIGAIFAAGELGLLLYLFWTKSGNSLLQYQYTSSFLQRFPLLYIAFMAVAIFFELLRSLIQKELTETRANFKYLSDHDSLTGLYNRMGFNTLMDEHFQNNRDKGFALAIMDLDDFKRVNDTFGHACGDMVLKGSAEQVTQAVGNAGTVCRWGGEEFAILFDSPQWAEDICQDILRRIEEKKYDFSGREYHITTSIGLVTMEQMDTLKPAELVIRTDQNLYQAKATGKNRLVFTKV